MSVSIKHNIVRISTFQSSNIVLFALINLTL